MLPHALYILHLSSVNKCEVDNGGCTDYCQDSPFSYTCSCQEGFTLVEDKHTCIGNQSAVLVTDSDCVQQVSSIFNLEANILPNQMLMNAPLMVMDVS